MYAILDIEATGGKFGEESIIEVAIYKFDGKNVLDQFISLVNPSRKIDSYVQKLTNITEKMVLTAPKFHEVAKRIVEITDGCILVGHNVTFDYRMLRQEFSRLGYNYNKDWIDTLEYSKKLIPNLPSYSLGKLCKSLGVILTDRHRASGDARATISLFKILLDKDIQKIITKHTGLKQPKKKFSKYQKILENLPNSIGVYYLYNNKKELIYICKSYNIFLDVSNLFSSKSKKANELKLNTKTVRYEETGSKLLATIKENNEIRINKPIYNKSSQNSKIYPYGLYYLESKRRYSRLEIGRKRKMPSLLGFKTKEHAKQTLDKIIHDYNLCAKVNSVLKSQEPCSLYNIKKCYGSCIGKESKEAYNQRIKSFIEAVAYPSDTFLIIENKGRKGVEKCCYLIEGSVFKGFAYFEYHYQIKSLEKIHRILVNIEETEEIKNTLKYFLFITSINSINKSEIVVF